MFGLAPPLGVVDPIINPSIKEDPMSRARHYSPALERFLVSVLYHEARHRQIPMTRLANDILKDALANSTGWQLAAQSLPVPEPAQSAAARPGK